jgi:hypothetical protein
MLCENCLKEDKPLLSFSKVTGVDIIKRAPISSLPVDLCYPCFSQACRDYKKETQQLYEETF